MHWHAPATYQNRRALPPQNRRLNQQFQSVRRMVFLRMVVMNPLDAYLLKAEIKFREQFNPLSTLPLRFGWFLSKKNDTTGKRGSRLTASTQDLSDGFHRALAVADGVAHVLAPRPPMLGNRSRRIETLLDRIKNS